MTHRERLERKIEKREAWAESRERKASADFRKASAAVAGIEPGQPILVGHHSERKHRRALEKHDSAMHRAFESQNMAAHHARCVAGIQDQLDRSIFSDDEGAAESLAARIDEREAERARIVAYNKSCRAALKRGDKTGDLSLLDESQKAKLLTVARVCPYQIGPGGSFPAYALSNLSGRIKADRVRLEQVKRRTERSARAAESSSGFVIEGADFVSVTFAEKPERAILDALKAAGFSWGRGSWCGYRAKLPAMLAEAVQE